MADENILQADFKETLKRCVQVSINVGTIAKGLHEVNKACETKNAIFVILAKDISACPEYEKLVKQQCKNNNIPIISFDKGDELGQWIGTVKYDVNKNIRKTKRCSSIAIKQFPAEINENERKLILNALK